MSEPDRYHKQMLFAPIGPGGQAAIRGASIFLAGCGAIGGLLASLMVRAGVGRLTVVDRDFPETSNLGRQILYDEADVSSGLPKAVIAEKKLRAINSDVQVQGVVADLGPDNIIDLIQGADLILDGLDNQETRYLINDAAVRAGVPWVYAGCIGSAGNVAPMVPGRTACLRCIFPHPAPPGTLPTCDTAGIIGPAASTTASLAAAEALKILVGPAPDASRMISFDLWSGRFKQSALPRGGDAACPCCGQGKFDFLEGRLGARTEILCGSEAVQVHPQGDQGLDLDRLAGRLPDEAVISFNPYLLRFEMEGYRFAVFPDGRVIIQGLDDPARARTLYDRFIGW